MAVEKPSADETSSAKDRLLPTKDERSVRDTWEEDMMKPLTSQVALTKLHDDIDLEISRMQQEFAKRPFMSWLMESISFRSELSKMRWPGVLFMTTQAIAHFIVSLVLRVENLATNWVGFQGLILSALLIVNLAVNFWDTKVRSKELLLRAEQIRDLVKRCSHDKHLIKRWRHYNWKSANARHLFVPKSPCIHQTLTYRDESCLNLPDFLLVRGDIIHLYPGDKAPGNCVSLASKLGEQERISLREDEVFHPTSASRSTANRNDSLGQSEQGQIQAHAKLKRARRGTDFQMLSTPYIKSLQISLQRSRKRPVNSIEKECFIVSRKYFETYVIPLVFVLSTIVTAIHYGYLDLTDSDQEIKTISIAYLLLRPSLTIMPFLPWMFPCFWMAVNAYGSARLVCCAESQRRKTAESSKRAAADWFMDEQDHLSPGKKSFSHHHHHQYRSPGGASHFEGNLLATPNAAGSSDQNRHEDELHDLQNSVKFSKMFCVFMDLILARDGHIWRSSSLLQVLGCLTSLCCIDKVGILSWSNPTPEKVFVVTKSQSHLIDGHHQDLTRQHIILNSSSRRASQSDDLSSQHHKNGRTNIIRASATAASQPEPLEANLATSISSCADDISSSGGGGQQLLGLVTGASVRGSSEILREAADQVSSLNDQQIIDRASKRNHHMFSSAHHHHNHHNNHRPEVLDVSQTFHSYRGFSEPMALLQQASRLQFDDPNWTKYLANLKPLGLAILMNNCCEPSFGDYFRFYKHISYESILRCNLTPVVKRRCLCSLAHLVGFSNKAAGGYKFVSQVGAYKLIDPSTIKKGKLVSSLENSTRLKLPFPNMICNIHRDTTTGGYQAFSQGTADVILDSCAEFWNGNQLVPLDDSTRKKIMDFYHRTSLTSHCAAFSYAPLLKSHYLHGHYIELPSSGSKFSSPQLRKLANEQYEEFSRAQVIPLAAHSGPGGSNVESPISSSPDDLDEHHQQPTSQHFHYQAVARRHLSAENIPSSSAGSHDEWPGSRRRRRRRHLSKNKKLSIKRRQLDDALDELTDQVFVGMVAMQYQACPDFVNLVEQLEHACIRFVHFSKENELRSRVFSEKMGLESGWNCHVSLQSDEDLDEADKSGANPLDSNRCSATAAREVSTQTRPFSPPARLTNILIGTDLTAPGPPTYGTTKAGSPETATSTINDHNEQFCDKSSLTSSNDDGTLHSWTSLPSLVMQIIARVSSGGVGNNKLTNGNSSGDELAAQAAADLGSGEELEVLGGEGTESSTRDEQGFDTLAFDMSNRAKLPKGIENIRPHLETVDNIPLQVSLFTDCTPNLTKEMIEIMQDYGEIVCVIGSASSRHNTPVFLQANASIAVEPLMPETCIESSRARQAKRSNSGGGGAASTQTTTERPPRRSSTRRSAALKAVGGAKDKSPGVPTAPSAAMAAQTRLNNPRDRLGIGPAIFNEQGDQFRNQIKRGNPPRAAEVIGSPSSSASSSSSSSSSNSDSDLDSERTNLSQTLSESDSETSASSSSRRSSSCSSSSSSLTKKTRRYRRRRRRPRRHNKEVCEENTLDGLAKPSWVGDLSQDNLDNEASELAQSLVHELPEPSSLASKLASLPCSYNYNRKEQVHLYSLIMEARHFTFKMKNTFVCMICFALSISSAQFLASILFLPPMLSSGLTIWLTVVVVPLMSFSLMATTMDSGVMKIAVGKNLQLKPENITFFVICYLIKFIPSIIVVVLNFGLIIAHSCKLTGFGSSSLGPCWMFTYVRHNNGSSSASGSGGGGGGPVGSLDDANSASSDEDLLWSSHLLTAQVSAAFLMVLYFVVISSSFVHRSHLIWQRSPTRNRFWVFISLTLVIGQVFYNQLVLRANLNSSNIPYEFLASLPLHIWLISFMWPVLVIGINLLVKRAEIKATIRQQRRARFDFNTKLGMNSPF